MATYDYKCDECDEVFEISKSMTEQTSKHIHKKCGAVCDQIYLTPPIFEEAFAGSYRSTNPKRAQW